MAGAIPILRPLRESLAGDRVTRVLGIVNGTTNFILDKMDTTGAGFAGGARGGPGARVRRGRPDRRRRGLRRRRQGGDPGQPRLPLPGDRRRRPPRGHHRRHGGRHRVGPRDGQRRQAAGDRRARDRRARRRGVSVRVHPAMIPRSHPLASVREAFNAVFVESEAAGQLMFYGPGAGGAPTASAVLGDLVTVARNRLDETRGPGESAYADGSCCPWARPGPATTSPSTGGDPDPLPHRHRRGRPCRRRNLVDIDVPLARHTVIVGENRSGKSNLLHAMRLVLDNTLSADQRRLPPEDFWEGLSTRDVRTGQQRRRHRGFSRCDRLLGRGTCRGHPA